MHAALPRISCQFARIAALGSWFVLGCRSPQVPSPVVVPQAPAPHAQAVPAAAPSGQPPEHAAPALETAPDTELQKAVAALVQSALASRKAADFARSLSDDVGARPTGSAGDRAATLWAERSMRELGLSSVRRERVLAQHWERGVESGALVGPVQHALALTALGGSVGTPPQGLEAPVVELTSLGALARLEPEALRGKILFVNTPMERTRSFHGYLGAVSARASWREAAKAGASAVVIRSVGTNSARLPHTGSIGYSPEDKSQRPIPIAALSNPDAELVHRVLERHPDVRLRLKLGARWLPQVESANVIGEVTGSQAPDQIVLLGAYLDSWDLGSGAVDDAAGCGIVLEVARLLLAAPERPKRTLRVVLFANEENGLAGAKAYAAEHAAELGRHVLALEADLGTARAFEVRVLSADGGKARFQPLSAALAGLGITLSPDHAHGGADLIPLRAQGVPVVDVQQDLTHYFDIHHSADDTADKLDAEALAQVSAAFAAIAYGATQPTFDLGRIPEALRRR